MALSQMKLDEKLKNELYADILKLMAEKYSEVLCVAPSESSTSCAYNLASPVVDEDRNEKWIVVSVAVPRKTRAGEAYDGYAMNEIWRQIAEEKAEKAKAKAEKEAKKTAKKGAKKDEEA